MADEFDNFYKGLKRIIQRELKVAYPIMGIITQISSNREYCDVQTDDGVISNVPAHGIPIIGDSVIVHFINGNYEQPVAECARREPTPTSELKEMYTSRCFNYHDNGDFEYDSEGYLLDNDNSKKMEIFSTDDDITGNGKVGLLEVNSEISFEVDISKCETEYFKFQCNYMGNGYLAVFCEDADTNEIKKTVPENTAKEVSIWESLGRFSWTFNKETYARGNSKKIRITLANTNLGNSSKVTVNGETVDEPSTLALDGLLVYDENGDVQYYNSVNDYL